MGSKHGSANYNHSQIEEAEFSREQEWEKRIKPKGRYRKGFETKLGHAYSMVLESFANEGLDSSPDLAGFLEFIRGKDPFNLPKDNEKLFAMFVGPLVINRPSESLIYYVRDKGLSAKATTEILFEIYGRESDLTDLNYLKRTYGFEH